MVISRVRCEEIPLCDILDRFGPVLQHLLSFLHASETRELRPAHSSFAEPLVLSVVLRNIAAFHPSKPVTESLATAILRKPSPDELMNIAHVYARGCGGNLKRLMTQDKFGRTPLYMAVKNSCESLLPVLLDMGAAVDVGSSTSGWSPLTLAAWRGSSRAIDCLLDHGADPDHDGNADGWTPLVAAASAGFAEICYQLLDHGANLNHAKHKLKSGSVPCCRQDVALHLLNTIDHARKGLPALVKHDHNTESFCKARCNSCPLLTDACYNDW